MKTILIFALMLHFGAFIGLACNSFYAAVAALCFIAILSLMLSDLLAVIGKIK